MFPEYYKDENVLKRFLSKIKKDKNSFCWIWIGTISWKGYGTFCVMKNRKSFNTNAHRVSYMIYKGEIPEGMTVHHICHNKKCVNPNHLELKTNYENRLEGNCWSAVNARKTHCKNGHEFNKENIYYHLRNGSLRRYCRLCRIEATKKWTNKEKLWKSN
jgi:hypothetical protein